MILVSKVVFATDETSTYAAHPGAIYSSPRSVALSAVVSFLSFRSIVLRLPALIFSVMMSRRIVGVSILGGGFLVG